MIGSEENIELCSICKSENPNYITSCNHHFHGDCLYAWFKKNPTCPVCRKNCSLRAFLIQILSTQIIENIDTWEIRLGKNMTPEFTQMALKNGNVFLLNNLLALDAIIDKNDFLHESALCGNLEFIKIMLNNGTDINSIDSSGRTALYFACELENLEIVKVILELHTIKVSSRGPSTSSVLFVATQTENVELLTLLLQKEPADINVVDFENGVTPLQLAFSEGNIELIDLLFANGADPSLLTKSNQSILDIAILQKDLELILKAYEICPDIKIKNTPKFNAILSAIQLRSLIFLKNLSNSGILINDFLSKKKKTILIAACETPSLDIVQYLIETFDEISTTIDATDSNGMTALHHVCESGNCEIVDLLLSRGADRNHQNISDGSTALITATKTNNTNIVKILFKYFCNVNLRDKSDKNALDYAIELGNNEIVEQLFARGVHVSAIKRALVKICSLGNLQILDIFIKNGILDKYNFGMTLFHQSADFDVILKLSQVEIRKRKSKGGDVREVFSGQDESNNQIDEDLVNLVSSN